MDYGDTFDEIQYVIAYIEEDLEIHFEIETLEVLPSVYFEESNLITKANNWPDQDRLNSSELLRTFEVTKDYIHLSILKDSLPNVGENRELEFLFRFNDRRDYIDCQHGGSQDSYHLDLNIYIHKVTQDSIEVTEFTWNESFLAGHY